MDINGKPTITSAKYIADPEGENNCIEAVIEGIIMGVPIDTANNEYKAILEWVADGNTIAESE